MMKLKIDVMDNRVMFEGHLMSRPRRITRCEWVEFWNRANGDPRIPYNEGFTEGHALGIRETKDRCYEEGYEQGYEQGHHDGLIAEEHP